MPDLTFLPSAAQNIPLETFVVLSLYVGLGIAYLLLLPLALFAYLQWRWYVASSVERTLMYFLVLFLFPGMLLLSPFLNFRPKRRPMEG